MLTRMICAALAALALLGGCRKEEPVEPVEPAVQHTVLLGPRTTAILSNPERVRAYRIVDPFDPQFEALKKTNPLFGGYPILAEAVVKPEATRPVSKLLLDPKSYDPAYAWTCLYKPRHAWRFERGADFVDVIVCFECSDLEIRPSKSLGEKETIEPFGRVAKPLWEAASGIVPADPPTNKQETPANAGAS